METIIIAILEHLSAIKKIFFYIKSRIGIIFKNKLVMDNRGAVIIGFTDYYTDKDFNENAIILSDYPKSGIVKTFEISFLSKKSVLEVYLIKGSYDDKRLSELYSTYTKERHKFSPICGNICGVPKGKTKNVCYEFWGGCFEGGNEEFGFLRDTEEEFRIWKIKCNAKKPSPCQPAAKD